MGVGSIADVSDGTVADASDLNQYSSALRQDNVPRNASGIATDLSGNLGQSSLQWLKAYIAAGYWTIGDIKPHHSYNGAAPIDQGWFPCDGTIISEASYNSLHGAGSWATYVITSALDGKYAPDATSGYLVGVTSTTKDGSIAITNVGNSSNQINVSHSHTVNSHTHSTPSHRHQWYNSTGSFSDDQSYNSSGSAIDFTIPGANNKDNLDVGFEGPIAHGADWKGPGVDYYTNNSSGTSGGATPGTNSQLSSSQDIRPNSVEVTYFIRII